MLWFRFYCESLNDPKIQTLPDASFKAWVNALSLAGCLQSKDGKIGTIKEVAFAFRVTEGAVTEAFHPLLQNGLLITVNETFQIPAWGKRQYKSDSSYDRVKRHRQRYKTVTVTAPETEQNRAEQTNDTNVSLEAKPADLFPPPEPPKPEEPKNAKRPKARKPTSFIPEDFGGDFKAIALAASLGVDFEREQRKFVDHFLAKGESRADWQAGFRNWINRAAEYRDRDQQRAASGRSDAPSVVRAALRVASRGPQAF